MSGTVFVACSKRVAANEQTRFGINADVIDNWIDVRRIRPVSHDLRSETRQSLGVPKDAFCIVSVGNCGPFKNHIAILHAVALCRPHLRVHYFHCGRGEGEEEEVALAERVGIASHVRFLGSVSNIGAYLLASDAFVSTSYHEGGQISLLEAAAAGIPCVTTKVGLAEEFEGAPNMHFIEPTAESLAATLKQVAARSIDERMTDGRVLSKLVLSRFVPSIGAHKYLELYEKLVSGGKA
jgi:glycosyltransferase involved in cell wall biosynthesis